ncbi:uncharacterized protein EI90DRAFT_2974652 [Cantharellus anzutake]|uniref:uncharacterized protein n=1 Tax=Cantharellus anzutake TaxID=1750568 RepID=UPI001908234E|nr:uncharacterized protein EI90DRAFT_2974652 [Cantharellus anzutake]KAF8328182.1 hypothetical protein EI90DRAFT_2974652 [Cantharellus anzutake]
MHQSTEEGQWERALWKKQGYPDNYVPGTFNPAFRRNARVRVHSYFDLVLDTCSVTQTLAIVFVFIATFCHLLGRSLDPRLLIWTCVMSFVMGTIAWERMDSGLVGKFSMPFCSADAAKPSILVFLALTAATPVLKTLTEASSSDSIWALAAMLFILHILLADYKVSPSGLYKLTAILSMNAAICAGVVLASRLETNEGVFALTLLAFELFGVYPLIRSRLVHPLPRLTLSVAISFYASDLMRSISTQLSHWMIFTLSFVSFACPGLFIWAQRFKNEIHGPWDPATPRVRVFAE